jgi:nucleotide-binding universal stress UspA family protein
MRPIMGEPEIDDDYLLDIALGLREDPGLLQRAERSAELSKRVSQMRAELQALDGQLSQLLSAGPPVDVLPLAHWRILLAVDDSASSGRACVVAARFAGRSEGSVIVFHAREMNPPRTAAVSEPEGDAEALLMSYADELRDGGIPVEPTLGQAIRGHEADSILEAAEELAADLIVIGAGNHSRLAALLLRHRTAGRVVANADRPVVVVS